MNKYAPWIQYYIDNLIAQQIEDEKYPEGHQLQEIVVTASGKPEDKMKANLQANIQRQKKKDAKDAYTLQRNMNQAQNTFAQKVGLPLILGATAPLGVAGWTFGSAAAHDYAKDKPNLDKAISIGEVGLLGLGAGVAGAKTLLNNTNWGKAYQLSRTINKHVNEYRPKTLKIKGRKEMFTPIQESPKHYRDPYVTYTTKNGDIFDMPLSQFFWKRVDKMPTHLINKSISSEITPELNKLAENENFIIKAKANIGPYNEMWSDEMLNRLKDLGYDTTTPIPLWDKSSRVLMSPKKAIVENSKKPVYLGIYNDQSSYGGVYSLRTDQVLIDPTIAKNLPSAMFHERVMHGTDNILKGFEDIGQGKAVQMYRDFTQRLKIPQEDDASKWFEARSTINELKRKYLNTLRTDKTIPLESYRENYLKYIDNLSDDDLLSDLSKINGYGKTYWLHKDKNPYFIRDLKNLLKYGAIVSTPIIVATNKE